MGVRMGRIKLRTLALGIFRYGDERRTCFEQLDGSFILADECTCSKDPFTCPIDKHSIEARQKELWENWGAE
jgi:hypothetical protein